MNIINSTMPDLNEIFRLYDEGTAYQKSVSEKHWQGFERDMVVKEIQEQRQWKIMIDGEIASVFCLTFSDPYIWKEKNEDPAVYIHRIATNPAFRGKGLVAEIVRWVKIYADENEKKFIRMDTGSGNDKLNAYYVSCGFSYLGITELGDTAELPAHYRGGSSSLFEISL